MYPDATGTTDFGRASEREVCYRVIAFNAQGNSTPSNVDCTTPPAPPTNVTATAVDSRTVDLSWTDNSGVEDGYEVLRSTDAMSFGTVASLPANSATYRDGVSENMTTCSDADFVIIATTGPTVRSFQDGVGFGVYTYRIRATNRLGDSAPSNVAYGRACVDGVDPESPCFP
jgi:hypothetical protein